MIPNMNARGCLIVVPLLLTAVLPIAPLSAQPDACDPGLGATKGEFGYRLRETRCEGLYLSKKVASTTLLLASFVATFPKSMPDDALGVAWTPPASAKVVYLRARDLSSKRYYRMDAKIRADKVLFRWPTDILTGLRMTAQDVGIVGWTQQSLAGELRKVYLPLRMAPSGKSDKGYQLVIVPGRRLGEVYLSLAPVGEDGKDGKPLLDDQPVGKDYRANIAIALSLPELPHPGLYHLEIGALYNRGNTSLDLYFYHPDREHP